MFSFFKERRRRARRAQPFPAEWDKVLRERCLLYRRLPAADRPELHGHIQVFLAEKRFEGCNGLELTGEMKLLIAAQACLLLLHREAEYFPRCSAVLVYPDAFIVQKMREETPGMLVEEEEVRSGESWHHDLLVLAWDEVEAGAEDNDEAFNVVLHEFAHALDWEDGDCDGLPPLPRRQMVKEWHRVMNAAYEKLCEDTDAGRKTFLDPYASDSPAEFFAVLTETFFMLPRPLRTRHPELYDQMKNCYQQDPAEWRGEE